MTTLFQPNSNCITNKLRSSRLTHDGEDGEDGHDGDHEPGRESDGEGWEDRSSAVDRAVRHSNQWAGSAVQLFILAGFGFEELSVWLLSAPTAYIFLFNFMSIFIALSRLPIDMIA